MNKNEARRAWVWLGLITLLAAALRFYQLDRLPPGLWHDEAWLSVQARTVEAEPGLRVYFPSALGGVGFPVIYLAALARAVTGGDPLAIRYGVAAAGALTTPLVCFALRALFRLDDEADAFSTRAALLGALAYAVAFPNVLLSRVGFESLLPAPFGALAFWALAESIRRSDDRYDLAAGAALGFGLYTYASARLLPFAAALGLAWIALLGRRWQAEALRLARVGAAALLAAAPLLAYFFQNPEMLTARSAFTSYYTLGPGADSVPLAVLRNAALTLAGFSLPGFGDVIARHNLPGRPVFDAFLSVAFWTGLMAALVAARRRGTMLLLTWGGVASLAVVLTDGAPTYPRLLAAMPALAGLCGLGVERWRAALVSRPRAAFAIVAAGFTFSTVVTAYDYFVRWPLRPELFDDFQVGDWQAARLAQARSARGSVYLSPLLIGEARPTFDLLLRDAAAQDFAGPGCLIYQDQPLRSVTYLVDALNDKDTVPALRALFPAGRDEPPILHPDGFALFEVFVVPAGSAAAPPAQTADAVFGGVIALAGYTLEPARPRAGEDIRLTLYWQALATPPADYTAFIHVLVAGEEAAPPRAQADTAPCQPTSRWRPGERVADPHAVSIPPDLAGSEIALAVGLYTWPDLTRLPAGGAGALEDGRLKLTTLSLNETD